MAMVPFAVESAAMVAAVMAMVTATHMVTAAEAAVVTAVAMAMMTAVMVTAAATAPAEMEDAELAARNLANVALPRTATVARKDSMTADVA